MDLRDILSIVKKRWIIVAAITIVVTGGVLAYSFLQTPVYEAKATCMVSATLTGENQYSAVQTIDQLIQTFSQIAVSRPVLNNASARINKEASPDQLKNDVQSSVVANTQILEITARDSKPNLAVLKANAVADSLIAYVNQSKGENSSYRIDKVEDSTTPKSPISPRPIRNGILGILLGLVLGLASALIIESIDVSVKSKEDVDQVLGLPVLAEVPRIDNRALGSGAVDVAGDSGILESIRTLRTNIQFLDIKADMRSILISSPNVGEGKTFISEQLARAFAAAGKSVVLVDTDLRKIRHQLEGSTNTVGLTDVIMRRWDIKVVIEEVEDGRLWRLHSGPLPPNPSELLDSAPMRAVLNSLRDNFGVIILDSSPIGMFADPLTLASMTDGTILVAEAGSTSSKSLKAAGDLLSKPNVNLLGVVLNKVKVDKSHRSYNYR